MVNIETWCVTFLEIVFKPAKKSQIRYGPTSRQKHA